MNCATGSRSAWVVWCGLALACLPGAGTQAQVSFYTDQQQWSAAAGGAAAVTTFHFDGPTETAGKAANDSTIVPSYSSLGVDFLPFSGTNIYPSILRNQGHQIADPNRDGLLGNPGSPASSSDLEGRAIRFAFNRPALAVGTYFNGPYLDGDGGFLRAFNASGGLIGETPISAAGGFLGLIADQAIVRVNVVNTFGSDLRFGIWDLQFSAVPEPSPLGVAGAAGFALLLRRRRRDTHPAPPGACPL